MGQAPPFRTIARVFFSVLALVVLVYVLYLIRSVIGLILIAIFLAIALGPLVDRVARLHVPRAAAILSVYLGLLGAIFLSGAIVVPPVVEQVQALAEDLPAYIEDLRANETVREYDDRYDITQRLRDQAEQLPTRLGQAAGALRSVTVGVFSALVQLITVMTVAFFLLLDGRRIVDFFLAQMSPERRVRVAGVAADVYRSTSGYVAGALSIAAICGVSSYIVLTILGVPFSVPLGLLMAFLALIPLVGATLGGIVIALVTVFEDFPTATIVWIVFAIVYQQVENNLLQPQIYKRAVKLHPLAIIGGILIGASLLGVLGALVAIPIAAAIQIVARDYWAHRQVRSTVIDRTGEPVSVGAADVETGKLIVPPDER